MENKIMPVDTESYQTLMQALERLDDKCMQLKELAGLTEKLIEKLKRTEGHDINHGRGTETKQKEDNMNIIELFNHIANKMEVYIDIIGNNTECSIRMIG